MVVTAPAEVSDEKMVQAREIVSAMLSGRPAFFENLSPNYLRIAIFKRNAQGEGTSQLPELGPDAPTGGVAFVTDSAWVAAVPERDRDCYTFIHEFAHVIQFALEDQPGGYAFESRLLALYEAALNAGLWRNRYAATNVYEYWAETVTFWFREYMGEPVDHYGWGDSKLEEYDPEIAKLIAETFGEGASVPSYCKP